MLLDNDVLISSHGNLVAFRGLTAKGIQAVNSLVYGHAEGDTRLVSEEDAYRVFDDLDAARLTTITTG